MTQYDPLLVLARVQKLEALLRTIRAILLPLCANRRLMQLAGVARRIVSLINEVIE